MNAGRHNWLAIVVLVVLSMAIGFTWYGPLFGEQWMGYTGVTQADAEANFDPMAFVYAIVSGLLVSWLISCVINLAGSKNAAGGAKIGFLIWLCAVAPLIFTHNAFSLRPVGLSIVEAGAELVFMVIAGAVLGVWRPKGR